MINNVIIGGHLTKSPELTFTKTGTAVTSLVVAVNERYKSQGVMREEVSFIKVVAYAGIAEYCVKFLVKGSGIVVAGRLRQDRWDDPGGNKRSKTYVMAESVQFVAGKKQAAGGDR